MALNKVAASILAYILIILIGFVAVVLVSRRQVVFGSNIACKTPRLSKTAKQKTEDKSGSKIKLFSLLLMIAVPLVFAGIRTVGADYYSYRNTFYSITFVESLRLDLGFFLYTYFSRLILRNYNIYLFVTSFLTLFLAYKGLYKLKGLAYFPVAVLFYLVLSYLQSFNLVRMYFAQAILIFALADLLNKKYFRYIVICLLASTIHFTAIIGLMFLLLRLNKKKISLFIIIAFVILLLFASQIFFATTSFLPGHFAYYVYQGIGPLVIGHVVPIKCLAMLLPLFYLRRRLKRDIFNFLVYVVVCYLLISLLGFRVPVIGRLTIHFFPIIMFLFAYAYKNCPKGDRALFKVYIAGFCAVWLLMYFVWTLPLDGLERYATIFNRGAL